MRTDLLQQRIVEWVGPLLLCPSEVRRVPQGIPGVYLLHALAHHQGGYTIFYVGKSQNLKQRLFQHLSDRTSTFSIRTMRRLESVYWSAAPIEAEALLNRIESGLIRALRPICNTQVPTALPVVVNLPPWSLHVDWIG